jgi:Family of unknown function (DUF5330)
MPASGWFSTVHGQGCLTAMPQIQLKYRSKAEYRHFRQNRFNIARLLQSDLCMLPLVSGQQQTSRFKESRLTTRPGQPALSLNRVELTMWFLTKTGLWFSLVLVMLPFFDQEATNNLKDAPAVEVGDAMTAASGVYDYVSNMCNDRPEVCTKGGSTLVALGTRAREGALVAYKMLDKQLAGAKTDDVAEVITKGTVPPEADAVSSLIEMEQNRDENVVTGSVRRIPVPTERPARIN